jgi:hypothetical protein
MQRVGHSVYGEAECRRGWVTVCMERKSAGEGGTPCVWRGGVQERVGHSVYEEAECIWSEKL